MFDVKSLDFGNVCMEAVKDACLDVVCQQAYEKGLEDGKNCPESYESGLGEGFETGYAAAVNDFNEYIATHMTVVNVVFDRDKTVVKFADGTTSVVNYDPKYGYPYDREKGIMAALLKHMCGNSYIQVLKDYNMPYEKSCCCTCDRCGCDESDEFDYDFGYDYDPEDVEDVEDVIKRTPSGDALSLSGLDKDLATWTTMPDDICEGFDE